MPSLRTQARWIEVCCTDILRSRVYTGIWRRPFLRGVADLYETIHLGMRALQWSALVQLGQDAEIGEGAIRDDASIASLVMFALALFVGVALLGGLLHRGSQSISAVLIEGAIRAAVLLAYLLLIELIPGGGSLSVSRRGAHGHQCARSRRIDRRCPRARAKPPPPSMRHRVSRRRGAGERRCLRRANCSRPRCASSAGSCSSPSSPRFRTRSSARSFASATLPGRIALRARARDSAAQHAAAGRCADRSRHRCARRCAFRRRHRVRGVGCALRPR